ncbi:hypothetical protein [Belliella aquatica]|uniref:SPOR domain-containing protein n=1 Tax=Belliella aquatica TaxID=1323734 RepID=A0ABQ1MV34_9BACT|nr:hypothetical protein [Belliella aquatica]MCH7406381.1 hypothetical protein [Belliella aquatica]GGC45612.1 hypothetical protein GCM10010993_25190 [Belliella aquatica]
MADRKNSNNNDFQEDQEYGFPFVEVVPLALNSESLTEEFPKEELEELESSAKIAEDEIINPTDDVKPEVVVEIEPAVVEIPKPESVEIKPIEIKKTERTFQSTTAKKKSNGPLIMILTLLILVVLGAMAYFLYYLPEVENGPQTANVEIKEDDSDSQNESAISTNEEPLADAEEMGEEIDVEVIPEVQQPIVAQSTPELTLIQSRESNPRYFVVVASVTSERLARSEAEKFMGMDKNTWIIFPYGDIRNYRIAVGKFDNIETATEAWETAKGEFGDAIWILKY